MHIDILDQERIKIIIEQQLQVWPFAKKNYDALRHIKRKIVKLGDYNVGVQYNPERIVSTGAKISEKEILGRQCFLCKNNRPAEQLTYPIFPEWELLVNPYPIFPIHFTVAASRHTPQSAIPEDIVAIAEKMPGMVLFFNGAMAGASAPDHMHLQAVLKEELPLLNKIEEILPSSQTGIFSSEDLCFKFPFMFFSGVIPCGNCGMSLLMAALSIGGPTDEGRFVDQRLVNAFFWIDYNGMLRFISIPRKAHRPSCYFRIDAGRRMVSPGCVDMAGVIISPLESDFHNLDAKEIAAIYADVAL